MNTKQALKHRDAAEHSLVDLWSRAAHFGMPHSWMLDERSKILDRVAKCPEWVRSYLSGYWSAMQGTAYKYDLVYGAIVDSRFYSTHSNRDDYYDKMGIPPSEFALNSATKGHYWIAAVDQSGNPKPFFTSPD